MNQVQRQLRTVSDHHCDDTSGELSARDRAAVALAMTEAALADGMVTSTEALGILKWQRRVLAACDLSLARNLQVQREIDAVIAWIGNLPADALATLPRPALRLQTDAPLFRADAICDADVRRRYPELGTVTVGQMVRGDDWPEAA